MRSLQHKAIVFGMHSILILLMNEDIELHNLDSI